MILAVERMALSVVKIKDNEDPKIFFERLKAVEVRFNTSNHKIKEDDRMAFMASQVRREFQAILTVKPRTKGAIVTTEDLEDTMNQYYRLINNGILINALMKHH